jgi:hypothetical protein
VTTTLGLAARTWLRYVVPLTLLSVIALAPIVALALRQTVATDLDGMRAQMLLAWLVAGAAWVPQLVVVAAVAPAVRAIAAGAPLAQHRALAAGARSLVRAIVPCAIAAAAVVLGLAALVVPGLVLLALVATTGASERLREPPPAPLLDAVAVARAHKRAVAAIVAAMLAANLAVVAIAAWRLHLYVDLPAKPPKAIVAEARVLVRATVLALVALSPLSACALAAVYVRETARPNGSRGGGNPGA